MSYEMCASCAGSGIGPTGDPGTNCWTCDGDGSVIARDTKGRFVGTTLLGDLIEPIPNREASD